jgi:hypothetical protein
MPFYGSRMTHCKRGHKFTSENTVLRERKEGVRRDCRTCRTEQAKVWRVGKIDKRDPMHIWARNLKAYYKLTPEQWQVMYDTQLGVCAICEQSEKSGKRLAVDHNHECCKGKKSCGKCVRGLICRSCNNGLGRFKDSPKLLKAAANYLEDY